jgi:two-component system sensor histidine kinase EvgS
MYPSWSEVSNAFGRAQVDMMATTERETPRLTGGIAPQPYESFPLVIVGRDGEPVVKGLPRSPRGALS